MSPRLFPRRPISPLTHAAHRTASRAALALSLAAFLLLAAFPHGSLGEDLDWSESARLADKSLLLDAAQQGDRLIAVGERGNVLLSEDGGSTWTQVLVPTRRTLTGVALTEQGHAWAVGHDAVIVHSADGGKTWTLQYEAPEKGSPLLDVWFENPEHGLAVGAYALVLETRDGGKTWEQLSVDEVVRHFNAIRQSSDGTLFVAAETGAVFRSGDKGKTWEALRSPYEGSFFGLLGLSDGSLLVFGLRGHLYRSADRGESWQEIPTGITSSLMSGVQRRDGSVVLVGLSGTVLLSRDGGNTFAPRNRPDRMGLAAVLEPKGGGIVSFGEGGVVRIQDLDH